MSSVEYMLVRLTAQTNWKDKQMPGGGKPELTVADISVIAAQAPHMSYHALMAKYCEDPASEAAILKWTHEISLKEWFSNQVYESIRIEAGQMNRVAELAVLAWLAPWLPHGTNTTARAAYIGSAHETYRKNFQPHYAFLVGELGHLEMIGREAMNRFVGSA